MRKPRIGSTTAGGLNFSEFISTFHIILKELKSSEMFKAKLQTEVLNNKTRTLDKQEVSIIEVFHFCASNSSNLCPLLITDIDIGLVYV